MAIVNTLEVAVTAKTDKFSRGMKKARESVQKLGTGIKKTGAPIQKFSRGMKKANVAVGKFAKSNKNLGDVLKNAKDGLLSVNPVLLATGVIAVGATVAIVRLTTKTAQYAESLQKMSLRLGLGVEAIEELRFAAEQSGASLESLTPAFRALARAAFEASLGTEEYLKVFRELGVEVTDENGKLKELDMLLEDVADGLAKTEGSTKKLALAQMVLGRGATELLPLFENAAEGIRELRKERQELGRGISVEFARESADFVDNLNRVRTVIRAGGITIAEEFLPSFNLMLDGLVEAGKAIGPEFDKDIKQVGDDLEAFGKNPVIRGIFNLGVDVARGFNKMTEGARLIGPLKSLQLLTLSLVQTADAGKAAREGAEEAAEGIDAVDDALDGLPKKLDAFSQAVVDALAKINTIGQTVEETIKAAFKPLEALDRATEDRPQILPSREEVQGFAEGTVTALDILRGEALVFFDDLAAGARSSLGIAARFAEGFGEALVDSATEGSAAFAKFFKSLAKQIANAIVRALVLRSILGIFGLGSGGFLKDVGKLLVGSGGGQMIPPTRMTAILGTATAGGDPGALASGGGNIASNILQPSVRVQILEPSPLTRVQFVDDVVAPRMRQRSDELNEEPL